MSVEQPDAVTPKKRSERRRHKVVKDKDPSASQYSICKRSGGKFGTLRPVFSKDERYVFLSTKSEARVYSATTGELVRSLTGKRAHKGTIVSMFLHPTNEFRLIVITLENQVMVWDWTDGALLQHSKIDSSSEVISAVLVGSTLALTDGRQVMLCKDFPASTSSSRIANLSVCLGLSAVKEKVYAFGEKQVMTFIIDEPNVTTREHEYLKMPTALVSWATSETSFAYADASGAIYLYSNDLQQGKSRDMTPRKLHWHSSTVSSLSFALNGEYLLSGGLEGVLVLWQLVSSNKQFLPRIAHKIDNISVSPSSKLYALKLNDNTIKIITATNLALQTEIVGPRYATGQMNCAFSSDDVLLSNGAEVQAWNLSTDRSVLRVPVTAQTYAGRVNEQFASKEANVSDCAVQGEWMATIDTWTTPKEEATDLGHMSSVDETYLKFWRWGGKDYELITRIDDPHGEYRTAQVVATTDGTFYTVGTDGAVKVWRQKVLKKDLIGGGTQVVGTTWGCRSVIKFTKLRSNCRIAISPDNSVLALSANDQIFLIDPTSGEMRTTITALSSGRVKQLAFVKNALIILGHKRMIVWDLMTASVAYALRMPETTSELHLVAGQDTFMLGTNEQSKGIKSNSKIFIFSPNSPKPIFREKCARTLTIGWSAKHGFIQVDVNLELLHIAKSDQIGTPVALAQTEAQTTDVPRTGISTAYRVLKRRPATVEVNMEEMQQRVLNTHTVNQVLEDPAKTLEDRFADLALLLLGEPTDAFAG